MEKGKKEEQEKEEKVEKKSHFFIKFLMLIIVIICSLYFYAKYVGVKGLVVKEYRINSEILSENFDGIKIVHFSDILGIVNELKNAGAEAISINDQRIVSTTSITCEGNVINVNGEKTSSPFVIKAIGSSIYMNSALTRAGGTVENLNRYIQISVKPSNNITIKKYTGVINPKYIKYEE